MHAGLLTHDGLRLTSLNPTAVTFWRSDPRSLTSRAPGHWWSPRVSLGGLGLGGEGSEKAANLVEWKQGYRGGRDCLNSWTCKSLKRRSRGRLKQSNRQKSSCTVQWASCAATTGGRPHAAATGSPPGLLLDLTCRTPVAAGEIVFDDVSFG